MMHCALTRSALLLLLVLPGAMHGQVLAPQVREKTLNKEAILFKGPADKLDQIDAMRDPFAFYTPPVEVTEEEKQVEAGPAKPVRLPDAEALQLIARNFRPKGSLISGSRRLLVLPQGQNVPLGASFSATINDQTYEVEVAGIESGGYTLRLNQATISRTFDNSQR